MLFTIWKFVFESGARGVVQWQVSILFSATHLKDSQ